MVDARLLKIAVFAVVVLMLLVGYMYARLQNQSAIARVEGVVQKLEREKEAREPDVVVVGPVPWGGSDRRGGRRWLFLSGVAVAAIAAISLGVAAISFGIEFRWSCLRYPPSMKSTRTVRPATSVRSSSCSVLPSWLLTASTMPSMIDTAGRSLYSRINEINLSSPNG